MVNPKSSEPSKGSVLNHLYRCIQLTSPEVGGSSPRSLSPKHSPEALKRKPTNFLHVEERGGERETFVVDKAGRPRPSHLRVSWFSVIVVSCYFELPGFRKCEIGFKHGA